MTTQNSGATPDPLISEWHKKAWLKRMFLPGDFLQQVSKIREETMVCQKTTMDYLVMTDEVANKTIKSKETRKYSIDENYRPKEFKNETLKIITNAVQSGCSGCSGSGKGRCGKCSGSGASRCNKRMNCRLCRGSGQREEGCRHCGGAGQVSRGRWGRHGNIDEYEHCSRCGGRGRRRTRCGHCRRGKVNCDRCGGRGRIVCDRCSGSGTTVCGRCDGMGVLVEANIITRKFRRSTDLTHQLTGLAADEFKNGLAAKHFSSLTGDLIHQGSQTPASNDIVLQRQSVHSYNVLSHRYSFDNAEFWLNRISSGNGSKYATSALPLSRTRVAVVGATLLAAALVVAAVASAMALI